MNIDLKLGDCLDKLKELPDNSVDSIVTDPFMGSGLTGKACVRGQYNFIGIEKEEEYIKIAEARINYEYQHITN